jgi:hypothetical protein
MVHANYASALQELTTHYPGRERRAFRELLAKWP